MKIGRAVVHALRLPLPRPLRASIHDIRAVDTVLAELQGEGGAVVLPERPGIGLGLNRAALARFRA
jgi:L-alanine-DL-glutamate epimerase-like enolase superfamily enzyme